MRSTLQRPRAGCHHEYATSPCASNLTCRAARRRRAGVSEPGQVPAAMERHARLRLPAARPPGRCGARAGNADLRLPSAPLPQRAGRPAGRWLARTTREAQIDLIHCNHAAHLYGSLAARWANVPEVWHIYDYPYRRDMVDHLAERLPTSYI